MDLQEVMDSFWKEKIKATMSSLKKKGYDVHFAPSVEEAKNIMCNITLILNTKEGEDEGSCCGRRRKRAYALLENFTEPLCG